MKEIKIAVVGPGLIGKQHIRLINENPETSLAAIVAPDHDHNHQLSKTLKTPLFHELNSCIKSSEIDGVIISSPNQFHFEQASFCIKQGIPVFIEKPITPSVREAELLVDLVERHQAKVLIGHHRAHSPLLAKAREIIKEGRLGRIVSITGSAQFYKPESYFSTGPWRTQPGGGPILINLIHEIGNFRSLCGEISAVHAFSSSNIRNFSVEDTVSINLYFKNGVLGNFILSDTAACARSWEHTSQENPSYPTYPDEDCYVICGTLGYLSFPTFRLKYYENASTASWWESFREDRIEIKRKDPLACQLNHFIKVIKGEESPLVSAFDGLQNLKITASISKSASEGCVIYM